MNFLSIDFIWLILILISINFMSAALIRTEERFWLPQIITWLLLLGMLLFQHTFNREQVVQKQMVYDQQTDPNDASNREATLDLEEARRRQKADNIVLVRLLGLQSLFTCLAQGLGYRRTMKKQFRSGAQSFLFLFFLYLIFEIVRLFVQPSEVTHPF